MQNRKYCSIAHRVQKLVAFPASFQGTGFGFSISDEAGDDEIRVVERSS